MSYIASSLSQWPKTVTRCRPIEAYLIFDQTLNKGVIKEGNRDRRGDHICLPLRASHRKIVLSLEPRKRFKDQATK